MNTSLRMTVYSCVLAALMVVGAYISIPVGPVPIVLANFFVLLAGLLLGSRWGVASVAIYLVLGALGLPVFAGGSAGIGVFAGPTGGYLVGYLAAALVVGLVASGGVVLDIVGLVAGALAIYALGIPWLKHVLNVPWPKAFALGMVPFLAGDAIKVAAAFAVVRVLKRSAPELFPGFSRASADNPPATGLPGSPV